MLKKRQLALHDIRVKCSTVTKSMDILIDPDLGLQSEARQLGISLLSNEDEDIHEALEDAGLAEPLCSRGSKWTLLEHWLCLDDDDAVSFDEWASAHADLQGLEDALLPLSSWQVSTACRLTWILVRKLMLSELFVSIARGHMGDIDAIVRDTRLHALIIRYSDLEEAEELLCQLSPAPSYALRILTFS